MPDKLTHDVEQSIREYYFQEKIEVGDIVRYKYHFPFNYFIIKKVTEKFVTLTFPTSYVNERGTVFFLETNREETIEVFLKNYRVCTTGLIGLKVNNMVATP